MLHGFRHSSDGMTCVTCNVFENKVNWIQQIHWDQLRSPWIALAASCSPMCYLLSVLAADKTYCTSVNVGQCLSKCSYAVLSSGSCTSPHCTWAGFPRRVPGIACTLPWPGPTNNSVHNNIMSWPCTIQQPNQTTTTQTTKLQTTSPYATTQ